MTQRSILITGCSSGIGLDAARTLKARGWHVIATARKPDDIARLKSEDGLDVLHLELADPASIEACARGALQMTDGKLGALFNNAAYGQPGAVEDITPEVLRHQIEVNLIGTHDLTRRVIPSMRKNGHGRIVQCSSVLGMVAVPYRGSYCASKFALEALTASMRLELEGTGIKVALIEPGPIRSRFVETALASFVKNVDMETSAHRGIYKARAGSMKTGGKSLFKLEPAAVTVKLIHAIESSRPRRHYYVTTPTYAAAALKRVLPPAAMDYLAKKL